MSDSVSRGRSNETAKRSKVTRPNKRKRLRRILTIGFLFLLMIGGSVAASFYWQVDEAIKNASSNNRDGVNTLAEGLDDVYHSDKPLSIVILGRDTRKETGSMNTDVMIVSVVNPVTKQVTMLSLPRDTRIKIPGYRGYHKINAIYANGEAERRQAEVNGQTPTENGVTLAKKTLEQMLGVPIQYYVEVDFDGFKSIIDELGGVEVNVDRKLVYDDPTDNTHINLEPGIQTLNGEQALGYVRHRHDNRGTKYYSNDFDRNRRQQEVIRSIMDKMTSFQGFTKISKVIEVAGQHVHTDLSPEQIKGLAVDFKGVTSSNITTLENKAYWNPNISYTLLPAEQLKEIRSTLKSQMGITDSVAEVNDSSIGDDNEVTTNTKPRKKQTTKASEATPAKTSPEKPKEKPATTEQPKTDNPPADVVPPGSTDSNNTQPDATVPTQPETGSSPEQTPPPDITAPPADIVSPPPTDTNTNGSNSAGSNGTNG